MSCWFIFDTKLTKIYEVNKIIKKMVHIKKIVEILTSRGADFEVKYYGGSRNVRQEDGICCLETREVFFVSGTKAYLVLETLQSSPPFRCTCFFLYLVYTFFLTYLYICIYILYPLCIIAYNFFLLSCASSFVFYFLFASFISFPVKGSTELL